MKEQLKEWVVEALKAKNGKGKIVELSKFIWENHQGDLKKMKNVLYT